MRKPSAARPSLCPSTKTPALTCQRHRARCPGRYLRHRRRRQRHFQYLHRYRAHDRRRRRARGQARQSQHYFKLRLGRRDGSPRRQHQLAAPRLADCLEDVGIAFLFAPAMHSAMRYVQPARRELRLRTVFNLLGPLTNPAHASAQVVGVYSADWWRNWPMRSGCWDFNAPWWSMAETGSTRSPSPGQPIAEVREWQRPYLRGHPGRIWNRARPSGRHFGRQRQHQCRHDS